MLKVEFHSTRLIRLSSSNGHSRLRSSSSPLTINSDPIVSATVSACSRKKIDRLSSSGRAPEPQNADANQAPGKVGKTGVESRVFMLRLTQRAKAEAGIATDQGHHGDKAQHPVVSDHGQHRIMGSRADRLQAGDSRQAATCLDQGLRG